MVPDLARREPVWQVLADMYLDNELQEYELRHMAAVFGASGYSWAEIKQINYDEVAPALLANLYAVAGEWAGWDPAWLRRQLLNRYTGTRQRLLGSVRCWEWWVDSYTKDILAKVVAYLPPEFQGN